MFNLFSKKIEVGTMRVNMGSERTESSEGFFFLQMTQINLRFLLGINQLQLYVCYLDHPLIKTVTYQLYSLSSIRTLAIVSPFFL